jgi:hypothetical protein
MNIDEYYQGAISSNLTSQDRFLPIVINLEQQEMLDVQVSSIIKTLILEENLEVFRLINSFLARMIDEAELCGGLVAIA